MDSVSTQMSSHYYLLDIFFLLLNRNLLALIGLHYYKILSGRQLVRYNVPVLVVAVVVVIVLLYLLISPVDSPRSSPGSSLRIISDLQNQEVSEDEPVSMSCIASEEGHTATWFKAQNKIDDISDKYHVESEGDTFTLTIPKSAVSDSAEYTIRIGDVESSGTLVVNGEKCCN